MIYLKVWNCLVASIGVRRPSVTIETIETENLMDCWGLLLRMFAIQTENMIVWDFKTNSALLCHDL